MKRIYANEEVCIGCRLCEIWCVVEHSKSKDIIKAFKHELQKSDPKVLVEISKPVSFALQCRHCKEPDCVYACIGGALFVDKKNGTVQHNADKCVGCASCIMVCPYGAIALVKDKNDAIKAVSKCDLCPDIEIPACVAHCPNEALVYVEEEIE
ncbi:MAG: 4Fe-4S dicluster domain-containing protein [Promethearchaeota archaeon]